MRRQRYGSPRQSDRRASRGSTLGEVARGDVPANSQAPLTGAGPQEYGEFFSLYSVVAGSTSRCSSLLAGLAGKEGGMYFLPLGFIPGPACILRFRGGQVRVTSATPDVKSGMEIPTDWMKLEELPEKIRQSLETWQALVQGLGREPSPWNLGIASDLLQGQVPRRYLAMGFPAFQWEGREQAFGLVLVLTEEEDELKIERVYNPANLPAPTEGAVLLVEELMEWGQTPLAKLLRTWAKMEAQARQDRRPNRR